jgi:CHASE3 domain sensor protein
VFSTLFERARQDAPAAVQHLQDLVSDNPGQETLVRRFAVKAEDLLEWHATNIRLVRQGAAEDEAMRKRTLQGKNKMDALRHDMADFVAEELRLDGQREQSVRYSQDWLHWLLVAGTTVSLLSTVLLGFSLAAASVPAWRHSPTTLSAWRRARS